MSLQPSLQHRPVAERELLARVPPFPPVALKLQRMMASAEVNVPDVVGLLRADPVLSVQLLRVANSALFGFRSQVDSLHSAVVLLGLDRLQTLALTIAAGNYMRGALQFEELRRCWRHTLASAVLAEELATRFSLPPDRAYTAGLLHDIGRLGLLVVRPKEYAGILREADRNAFGILELERKLFGLDHSEAGAWLAEHWELPLEIRVIAGRHHDSQSGGERDLLALVHWSCRLADTFGFFAARPFQIPAFEELQKGLNFGAPEELESLRQVVEARVLQHDSLDLQGPEVFEPEPAASSQAPLDPPRAAGQDWLVGLALVVLFSALFVLVFELLR